MSYLHSVEETEIDIAIIGAGIIGLACAWEISQQFPSLQLALFEAGPFPGEHVSSRNSGVLHAGLYYPPGSLKQKYCLDGNLLWDLWSKKLDIPIWRCGKYIVATRAEQVEELHQLYLRAEHNGAPGLRLATISEKRELQQNIYIDEAFFSSRSGIIDVSAALKILQNGLYSRDVPLMLNTPIMQIIHEDQMQFVLQTQAGDSIRTKVVINAAGMWSCKIRQMLGLLDWQPIWVKGNYIKTRQKLPFKNLIYPIPPKDLKGLGVHLTIDMQQQYKFGPDTEDITAHLEYVGHEIDYKVQPHLVERMYPAISELFKNINPNLLYTDYAGIRPKIAHGPQKFHHDFLLQTLENHGIAGYIEFCGVESPGLTAAPALAMWAAENVKKIF